MQVNRQGAAARAPTDRASKRGGQMTALSEDDGLPTARTPVNSLDADLQAMQRASAPNPVSLRSSVADEGRTRRSGRP